LPNTGKLPNFPPNDPTPGANPFGGAPTGFANDRLLPSGPLPPPGLQR
jgi:hypothetical protein